MSVETEPVFPQGGDEGDHPPGQLHVVSGQRRHRFPPKHTFSTSPNVPSAVTAGSPTHTGPGGTSEMAPPSILGSEEFRVNVTELRPERQEARRRWKFEQGLGVRTQGWAPQGGVWASLRHASPSPQHPWVELLCVPCWMGLLIMVADFELYGAPSFHTR